MGTTGAARDLALHIREELATIREDGTSAIARIMEPLRALLGFQLSLSFGYEEHGADGFRATFIHASGGCGPARVRDVWGAYLASCKGQWGSYDPRRPERWHWNVVLDYSVLVKRGWVSGPVSEVVLPKLGLAAPQQLRVLVCEGPSLLGFVGGYRQEPYSARDKARLYALVPSLRRRMSLDRVLAQAAATQAALDVALEEIAKPAYVLTATGAPAHANAAGKRALEADPRGTRRRLADAMRRQAPSVELRPIAGGARYLALERVSCDATSRAIAAASRWELTRRQADVLTLLVEGASNARIAAELGISDRTVEVHLTAIFDRAGVASRAALIAAVHKTA